MILTNGLFCSNVFCFLADIHSSFVLYYCQHKLTSSHAFCTIIDSPINESKNQSILYQRNQISNMEISLQHHGYEPMPPYPFIQNVVLLFIVILKYLNLNIASTPLHNLNHMLYGSYGSTQVAKVFGGLTLTHESSPFI